MTDVEAPASISDDIGEKKGGFENPNSIRYGLYFAGALCYVIAGYMWISQGPNGNSKALYAVVWLALGGTASFVLGYTIFGAR
jgi:hypothetical protein